MITPKINLKKWLAVLSLVSFGATAFAASVETLDALARKANRGNADAQKQLAARYLSGHEVVTDDVLAEQWHLRADPKMSPKSGGNALAALQKKKAEAAAAVEKAKAKASPVAASEPAPKKAEKTEEKSSLFGGLTSKLPFGKSNAEAEKPAAEKKSSSAKSNAAAPVDFHRLLRAASQGNQAALQKFRSDASLYEELCSYAKTPEGKRNPFVKEVMKKLKK